MNTAIEFHDSVIGRVEHEGSEVRVVFAPAYVHRSDGEPGFDAGTGWVQPAVFVVRGAVLSAGSDVAGAVWDGELTVGGQRRNLLPCPFTTEEPVELVLELASGLRFSITGVGAVAEFSGEAKYVEDVEP